MNLVCLCRYCLYDDLECSCCVVAIFVVCMQKRFVKVGLKLLLSFFLGFCVEFLHECIAQYRRRSFRM